MRTVALPGGERIPVLGQGTWYMGERRADEPREIAALRLGVNLGMTLIDTAEMYGSGGAERVVGAAVADIRDEVFIVSKVLPQHASRVGVVAACEGSLRRLRTDRIDLYLLHWRGAYPLTETVAGFETLKAEGKIRYWGVSNFDTPDMEELWRVPDGVKCATDQVLYNPESRGIEFDLLPWCIGHEMPLMAYSPLGHHVRRLLGSRSLQVVARWHGVTPAAVAVAWGLRSGHVISIPKAADPEHVRENARGAELTLTADDLAEIDAEYPPPTRKLPLELL